MTDAERVAQAIEKFNADSHADKGKGKEVEDFYDVGSMLRERWEKEEEQRQQQKEGGGYQQEDAFATPGEVDFDSPLPQETLSTGPQHAQMPLLDEGSTSATELALHTQQPKHGRKFRVDARTMVAEGDKDRQELYRAFYPTLLRYLQCMPEGAVLEIDLEKTYDTTWIALADRLESIRKMQNPVEYGKVHANDLPRRAEWYDYIEDWDTAGRNEEHTRTILTHPQRSWLKEQATPIMLDQVWAATEEGRRYHSKHGIDLGRLVHVRLAAIPGQAEKRLVIVRTM